MKGNLVNLRVLAVCLMSVGNTKESRITDWTRNIACQFVTYDCEQDIQATVNTQCLRCWHCIADDCAEDPSDNYKASEKMCSPGQFCQKVYFEMVEESDDGPDTMHKSTVRGCSTGCMERNDFANCTEQLKTSRGCVHKHCCNDGDLCNSANDKFTLKQNLFYPVIILLCLSKIIK